MARREVKEARRAIQARIEGEAKRRHRPSRYAEITKLHPLTAKLTEGHLVLDEDDLVLGQWVEQYRKEYGLRVGDTLVVHRMHNGDWLAQDVVADRKVRKHVRTKKSAKEAKEEFKGGEGGGGGGGEGEPEEGSEELEAETTAAEELDYSQTKGFVNCGSDPTVARPDGFASVEWMGTVEPEHALDGDTLIVPPTP